MNAVAPLLVPPKTSDQNALRQWIAELTDYTPQQVEAIVAQLEKQKLTSPSAQ